MKKELKYFLLGVGSTILGIIVIFLSFLLFIWLMERADDNDLKNEQEFKVVQTINCDALKNAKFINNSYIFTNDGIYQYSTSKKYSNNTNCKKINDAEIEKVIGYDFMKDDHKVYSIKYDTGELVENNYNFYKIDYFANDEVIYVSNYTSAYVDSKETIYFLALKTDGKIYKVKYVRNYQKNTYEKVAEEVWQEYADEKILMFSSDEHYDNDTNEYVVSLHYLKTDKSIYLRENNNKEECQKYIDVKCTYELVKNAYLSKINNKIIGKIDYGFILNDGSLIEYYDNN